MAVLTKICKLNSGRDIDLSVDKVLSIAKTVATLKIRLPTSNRTLVKAMIVTKEHKKIEVLF